VIRAADLTANSSLLSISVQRKGLEARFFGHYRCRLFLNSPAGHQAVRLSGDLSVAAVAVTVTIAKTGNGTKQFRLSCAARIVWSKKPPWSISDSRSDLRMFVVA
jgi:hypothetical protein